jgi:hypothetical protein
LAGGRGKQGRAGGYLLLEALLAAVVLGTGLQGVALLVSRCAREEGRLARHLEARHEAISLLEPVAPLRGCGALPGGMAPFPGGKEAWVAWDAQGPAPTLRLRLQVHGDP